MTCYEKINESTYITNARAECALHASIKHLPPCRVELKKPTLSNIIKNIIKRSEPRYERTAYIFLGE